MTDFVTADTHFGHTNIILHAKRPWCITNPNYDPSKPYNFKGNNPIGLTSDATENHDTALIESWNAIVGRKDRVFILGDFAWKNHHRYVQRLNGKKILIVGNHDNMNMNCLSDLYDEEEPGNQSIIQHLARNAERMLDNDQADAEGRRKILEEVIRMAWDGFVEHSQAGCIDFMNALSYSHFTEVHEMGCRKSIDLGHKFINKRGFESAVKQDITMSHFAMSSWPSSCWGSWHLYGHSHGRMPEWKNRLCFDVGVDVWGYTPIPMEVVKKKMDLKIQRKASDGETQPEGGFIHNIEERTKAIVKENLEILRSLGVKYIEKEL